MDIIKIINSIYVKLSGHKVDKLTVNKTYFNLIS